MNDDERRSARRRELRLPARIVEKVDDESAFQAEHRFAGRDSNWPMGCTTFCSCGAAFYRDDVGEADAAFHAHKPKPKQPEQPVLTDDQIIADGLARKGTRLGDPQEYLRWARGVLAAGGRYFPLEGDTLIREIRYTAEAIHRKYGGPAT